MSRLHPVLGRRSHSVLSCRTSPLSVPATRGRQPSCHRGGGMAGRVQVCILSILPTLAPSEDHISVASEYRTSTDIRPVRIEGRLAGVLSDLPKSRVQPVLVYLEVERALRDS